MNNKEITQSGQSKIIEEIIPGSDKEKERGERSKERKEERPAHNFNPGAEIPLA